MLNVLDEFTRESLAIRVRRKLSSADVIDVLTDLFILRGIPAYIRSDNGPEFVAEAVRGWIAAVGARTAFIEPGSPWENGYIESFNARLRDELLNGEIFYTLKEAQVLIESWQRHYTPSARTVAWDTGRRPRKRSSRQAGRPVLRYAPPVTQLGGETVNALTSKLDQSTGAGQGRGGLCLYINSGSWSLGAGESGLRRPLPVDILTGDVLAQKRELPVHAVKASPQLRQTGLNRPQPSVEAVQAGDKVPARLQSFLANM